MSSYGTPSPWSGGARPTQPPMDGPSLLVSSGSTPHRTTPTALRTALFPPRTAPVSRSVTSTAPTPAHATRAPAPVFASAPRAPAPAAPARNPFDALPAAAFDSFVAHLTSSIRSALEPSPERRDRNGNGLTPRRREQRRLEREQHAKERDEAQQRRRRGRQEEQSASGQQNEEEQDGRDDARPERDVFGQVTELPARSAASWGGSEAGPDPRVNDFASSSRSPSVVASTEMDAGRQISPPEAEPATHHQSHRIPLFVPSSSVDSASVSDRDDDGAGARGLSSHYRGRREEEKREQEEDDEREGTYGLDTQASSASSSADSVSEPSERSDAEAPPMFALESGAEEEEEEEEVDNVDMEEAEDASALVDASDGATPASFDLLGRDEFEDDHQTEEEKDEQVEQEAEVEDEDEEGNSEEDEPEEEAEQEEEDEATDGYAVPSRTKDGTELLDLGSSSETEADVDPEDEPAPAPTSASAPDSASHLAHGAPGQAMEESVRIYADLVGDERTAVEQPHVGEEDDRIRTAGPKSTNVSIGSSAFAAAAALYRADEFASESHTRSRAISRFEDQLEGEDEEGAGASSAAWADVEDEGEDSEPDELQELAPGEEEPEESDEDEWFGQGVPGDEVQVGREVDDEEEEEEEEDAAMADGELEQDEDVVAASVTRDDELVREDDDLIAEGAGRNPLEGIYADEDSEDVRPRIPYEAKGKARAPPSPSDRSLHDSASASSGSRSRRSSLSPSPFDLETALTDWNELGLPQLDTLDLRDLLDMHTQLVEQLERAAEAGSIVGVLIRQQVIDVERVLAVAMGGGAAVESDEEDDDEDEDMFPEALDREEVDSQGLASSESAAPESTNGQSQDPTDDHGSAPSMPSSASPSPPPPSVPRSRSDSLGSLDVAAAEDDDEDEAEEDQADRSAYFPDLTSADDNDGEIDLAAEARLAQIASELVVMREDGYSGVLCVERAALEEEEDGEELGQIEAAAAEDGQDGMEDGDDDEDDADVDDDTDEVLIVEDVDADTIEAVEPTGQDPREVHPALAQETSGTRTSPPAQPIELMEELEPETAPSTGVEMGDDVLLHESEPSKKVDFAPAPEQAFRAPSEPVKPAASAPLGSEISGVASSGDPRLRLPASAVLSSHFRLEDRPAMSLTSPLPYPPVRSEHNVDSPVHSDDDEDVLDDKVDEAPVRVGVHDDEMRDNALVGRLVPLARLQNGSPTRAKPALDLPDEAQPGLVVLDDDASFPPSRAGERESLTPGPTSAPPRGSRIVGATPPPAEYDPGVADSPPIVEGVAPPQNLAIVPESAPHSAPALAHLPVEPLLVEPASAVEAGLATDSPGAVSRPVSPSEVAPAGERPDTIGMARTPSPTRQDEPGAAFSSSSPPTAPSSHIKLAPGPTPALDSPVPYPPVRSEHNVDSPVHSDDEMVDRVDEAPIRVGVAEDELRDEVLVGRARPLGKAIDASRPSATLPVNQEGTEEGGLLVIDDDDEQLPPVASPPDAEAGVVDVEERAPSVERESKTIFGASPPPPVDSVDGHPPIVDGVAPPQNPALVPDAASPSPASTANVHSDIAQGITPGPKAAPSPTMGADDEVRFKDFVELDSSSDPDDEDEGDSDEEVLRSLVPGRSRPLSPSSGTATSSVEGPSLAQVTVKAESISFPVIEQEEAEDVDHGELPDVDLGDDKLDELLLASETVQETSSDAAVAGELNGHLEATASASQAPSSEPISYRSEDDVEEIGPLETGSEGENDTARGYEGDASIHSISIHGVIEPGEWDPAEPVRFGDIKEEPDEARTTARGSSVVEVDTDGDGEVLQPSEIVSVRGASAFSDHNDARVEIEVLDADEPQASVRTVPADLSSTGQNDEDWEGERPHASPTSPSNKEQVGDNRSATPPHDEDAARAGSATGPLPTAPELLSPARRSVRLSAANHNSGEALLRSPKLETPVARKRSRKSETSVPPSSTKRARRSVPPGGSASPSSASESEATAAPSQSAVVQARHHHHPTFSAEERARREGTPLTRSRCSFVRLRIRSREHQHAAPYLFNVPACAMISPVAKETMRSFGVEDLGVVADEADGCEGITIGGHAGVDSFAADSLHEALIPDQDVLAVIQRIAGPDLWHEGVCEVLPRVAEPQTPARGKSQKRQAEEPIVELDASASKSGKKKNKK